jgi:hypothetical protein
MLDRSKDFDAIENLVYASFCPPENVDLDDWHCAVGNEMWCELFYGVETHKKWQKQLLLKAADGIAFKTYLRPYSDEKGNVYFGGNYKNWSYNIAPKSGNILTVYMHNLDTGLKNVKFLQETVLDAAIKNDKRVLLFE